MLKVLIHLFFFVFFIIFAVGLQFWGVVDSSGVQRKIMAPKFGFLNIYLYICTNVYGRVVELVDATDFN